MPREQYDRELRDLQDDLLRLASMVESAIRLAMGALKAQNVATAQRVIADDDLIDRAQAELDEKAFILTARQAPMAADLRLISAVTSIANELERMGDYAEGIAQITIRGANEPLLKPLVDIPRMADLAQQMLHKAIDAFVNRNVEQARQLAEDDDAVDHLATSVQDELLGMMISQPADTERALHLMFVAHNLERIADRATNIGERLIFLVTNEVVALNN